MMSKVFFPHKIYLCQYIHRQDNA